VREGVDVLNDDDHTPDALDHRLDQALAGALVPPALPAGFHARLRDEVVAEMAGELARQRRVLEAQHQRELAALRKGYVRLRRETLAVVLAVAFTGGVLVTWAAPWLRAVLGVDLSLLMPLVAVSLGMAVGAGVWVERFGLPGWLRR
jgi:hypothetical protein